MKEVITKSGLRKETKDIEVRGTIKFSFKADNLEDLRWMLDEVQSAVDTLQGVGEATPEIKVNTLDSEKPKF